MSTNIDEKTDTLIKSLVQSRNYYKMLVKEIEIKLTEFSKKYEIAITLDE